MDAVEIARKSGGAVDTLLRRIDTEYLSLSPRLQSIARDIARNSSTFALDRIEDVAIRCGVPPSTLIRFARRFGFAGFRELRETFRTALRNQEPQASEGRHVRPDALSALLASRIDQTRASFETWQRSIDVEAIRRAGDQLARARQICIACAPPSFAAAFYCFHALLESNKAVELVTSMWPSAASERREPEDGETWLVIDIGHNRREMQRFLRKLAERNPTFILITTDADPAPTTTSCNVLAVAAAGGLDFDSMASTMTLCGALMATCTPV